MIATSFIAAIALASQAAEVRPQTLVDQLRADAVRWNAEEAMSDLTELSASAIPTLEQGLNSSDHQQRHMCAALLMDIEEYTPSRRLVEVCVEGLKHDQLPSDGENYNYVFNAANGLRYLIRHASMAREFLVSALSSDDAQQQFLAATILAYSGDQATCRVCAAILLPHLRDNGVKCDGIFAAIALRRISSCCVSELHAAKPSADAQQAAILEVLIASATGASSEAMSALNEKLPDLGLYMSDPTAFPLENVEVWWGAPSWTAVAIGSETTTPAAER